MDDFDKLAPLYAQVKQRLMERISNGTLSEGDFLPTEPELCEEMDVSRITIRRAVKELCDEGILIRQQGRGTIVARGKFRQTLVSLSGFSETFEKGGHRVDHNVLACDTDISDAIAEQVLSANGTGTLTRLQRLISVDERPFTLETLFLDQRHLAPVIEPVRAGASFFQTLRDIDGPIPASAERLINVGFATTDERRHLVIGPSQPVYRIDKTIYDSGQRPISYSRLVTATHLITYSVRS